MDNDKAEGIVQELTGRTQEALGAALGDTEAQVSGKARELSGKARQLYADTTSIVRDKTVSSPFSALAIMAFVGFLVGVMWSDGGNNRSSRAHPRSDRTNDQV
jgi:uncharacterized protein YjbJ (UPF0337 family)